MNRKIRIIILVTLCLAFTLLGCNKTEDTPYEPAVDEIALDIQLELKEDIGLLIVDYESNGSGGNGGICNADKSLLKHDDSLIYSIYEQSFDDPTKVKNLSLKFSIITIYVDPNYENIYPEEDTISMDPISVEVNFGETYYITIAGDKTNGYTATLNNED